MIEMPARRAASGLRNSTGAPFSSIRPSSGRSRPLSMLMMVLLPAPFSPSSACTSPAPQIEIDAVQHFDAAEALAHPAGTHHHVRGFDGLGSLRRRHR